MQIDEAGVRRQPPLQFLALTYRVQYSQKRNALTDGQPTPERSRIHKLAIGAHALSNRCDPVTLAQLPFRLE